MAVDSKAIIMSFSGAIRSLCSLTPAWPLLTLLRNPLRTLAALTDNERGIRICFSNMTAEGERKREEEEKGWDRLSLKAEMTEDGADGAAVMSSEGFQIKCQWILMKASLNMTLTSPNILFPNNPTLFLAVYKMLAHFKTIFPDQNTHAFTHFPVTDGTCLVAIRKVSSQRCCMPPLCWFILQL